MDDIVEEEGRRVHDGRGDGHGSGFGEGSGDGYSHGNGKGYGDGSSDGDGDGDGTGDGYGSSSGSGDGEGCGSGSQTYIGESANLATVKDTHKVIHTIVVKTGASLCEESITHPRTQPGTTCIACLVFGC